MGVIRKMEYYDVPTYNTIRNDSREYLHDNSHYTLQESYAWFRKNTDPFFMYEIDSEVIGYFRTSNWTKNTCYVGMDIHQDYRGKHLAYNAYVEFFNFLKTVHGIEMVQLEVLKTNTRALRLYNKLNFLTIYENARSFVMERKL